MSKYINEVGNLSIHESRVIGKFIADGRESIAKNLQMVEFMQGMIEQLGSVGQERAAAPYNGQLAEAVKSLIETYIYLGHCWTYFGDTFASSGAYRQALILDPDNVDAMIFLGRSLLEQGRYKDTVEILRRAREISPGEPMLRFYLGEACLESGLMEEAEINFQAALKAFPKAAQCDGGGKLRQGERWEKFATRAIEGLQKILKWRTAVNFDNGVEKDLARLEKIADGRPIFITHMCGKGWILSHMVNQIEAFVRHLHLDGVEDPFVIVLNPDSFCNESLVKMYDRKLWLVDERYPRLRKRLTNLREWLKSQGSPIAADIDPHNPRPHAVNYFESQLRCWTEAPQILNFTAEEEDTGREIVKSLGIPDEGEYACFGIREEKYYKSAWLGRGETEYYWMANLNGQDEEAGKGEELGAINARGNGGNLWRSRNEPLATRLNDYLPMAQQLAEKGICVLRMGAGVDDPIPSHMDPKVIDYAYNHRTEFGDVYLFANCKFVIAGGTGTMWISAAFGRPVVNTDMYLPNNAFFNTSRDNIPNLSIPRKFWYREENRFLTYGEVFEVFRRYQSAENCQEDGIENIPNTAEEIADVVAEMNARIDGVWEVTPEDTELQERYRALHRPRDHAYGCNGLIGTQFLRDNADLIR